MHTTIDYSKLEEPAKSAKALHDTIEYLGQAEFERITKLIVDQPKKDIIMGLSLFVGIQGFPAQVIADWYGAPEKGPNDYIVTLRDVARNVMSEYEMRIDNPGKVEAIGYRIVQHHRNFSDFEYRVDKVTIANNRDSIVFELFC